MDYLSRSGDVWRRGFDVTELNKEALVLQFNSVCVETRLESKTSNGLWLRLVLVAPGLFQGTLQILAYLTNEVLRFFKTYALMRLTVLAGLSY